MLLLKHHYFFNYYRTTLGGGMEGWKDGWMDTHPFLALAHKHSEVPDPRLGCAGYTCDTDAIQRQLVLCDALISLSSLVF